MELRDTPFQISVNDRCDGCGLCWTKCPAEAILPPLDGRDSAQPALGVICQKIDADRTEVPKGTVLRVPCVKEIGFRFLVARWMSGLRRLVVFGADCSGCNPGSPLSLEDGIERVNEILRVAGQASIEVVPSGSLRQSGNRAVGTAISDVTEHATSRRGLLKEMVSRTLDTAFPSTWDPSTGDEAGAPVAFLEGLDRLRNGSEQEREGRLAAYRLGIDTRVCYGCKVCATLCPTGALGWEEGPETCDSARMRVDPSLCHGCGVCVDLCDVGAMDCTFKPELSVQRSILFREERCRVCGRNFLASHPGDGLCPGCRIT
jgi:ferredoxin